MPEEQKIPHEVAREVARHEVTLQQHWFTQHHAHQSSAAAEVSSAGGHTEGHCCPQGSWGTAGGTYTRCRVASKGSVSEKGWCAASTAQHHSPAAMALLITRTFYTAATQGCHYLALKTSPGLLITNQRSICSATHALIHVHKKNLHCKDSVFFVSRWYSHRCRSIFGESVPGDWVKHLSQLIPNWWVR